MKNKGRKVVLCERTASANPNFNLTTMRKTIQPTSNRTRVAFLSVCLTDHGYPANQCFSFSSKKKSMLFFYYGQNLGWDLTVVELALFYREMYTHEKEL